MGHTPLQVPVRLTENSIQIPNAGINQSEQVCWGNVKFLDGKPAKPNLLTLDVNLTGVIYSEDSPYRL